MSFKLSKDTVALLEDIERRIDIDVEEDYENQWRDFLFDRFDGDIFQPERKKCSASQVSFAAVENINDAIDDYDLMLRHQLADVSASLNRKTVIFASVQTTERVYSARFSVRKFFICREKRIRFQPHVR